MSDVTDAPARVAANEDSRTSLQGSHIWYELMSPDPDGSKAFYEAVVPGWIIGEPIGGGQDYRMIGRSDGGNAGGVLRLTEEMREHGAHPIWMGYVGVDDVDATAAEIEAKGGKTLMPAFDIPQGRIAMIADPQGNPLYVMKPIPPEGEEDRASDVFSPTELQRVGWNELMTPDPMAARAFYGELFGWASDHFMPMGELGEYRFFSLGATTIGAVFRPQDEGFEGKKYQGWRYYIRVPSISDATEAVKANGGAVTMGPHEVPTGDHIIVGRDPQGAEFSLVGKA
ncbi:VOC family protein [Sphingomonas sp. G124]|uniref:VOC family protein n=1 Tax=Sphingomonas cremea TaxID=2904799 RepID=A0A9X1QMN4_9SPHN|nr:VOC family protein [Sphingomonas cremea]MCF2514698.1 VOC family protein [Sphingomonas cremea]